MAADIGKGPKRAVLPPDEQDRHVCEIVCHMIAGGFGRDKSDRYLPGPAKAPFFFSSRLIVANVVAHRGWRISPPPSPWFSRPDRSGAFPLPDLILTPHSRCPRFRMGANLRFTG